MSRSRLSFRRTLCLLALPALLASASHAAGTVEISFNKGWVSGSVSGMAPPWPFSFTLEGSFAEQSSATISFGDSGAASLTVNPADPSVWRRFVIEFPAGGSAPTIDGSGGPYMSPLLQTFDAGGKVVQSVWANGATGPSIQGGGSVIATPVPEPAAALLLLVGLGALPLLARRRRAASGLPGQGHAPHAVLGMASSAGARTGR